MKSLVALQDLIKEEEKRIKLAKQQLSAHESGENKLSFLALNSTENNLTESQERLAMHQRMLDDLLTKDLQELEEQERMQIAIQRKNYYQFQKVRLKRDKVRSNDRKLEALMILDELPEDVEFTDEELFDIADKSIELELSIHEQLQLELKEIKAEFDDMVSKLSEEEVNDLEMLNFRIPILVLQFSVLLANIKENREKDKLPAFNGFPKYEDWWINELWTSHQAYFALYKWKDIIKHQCNSTDQKRAWETIFANWVFVKKMLNGKGKLSYGYALAFDKLLSSRAELEEELSVKNLVSMESIIKKVTAKEDFNKVMKDHDINTDYLNYKREQLDYKEEA